MPELDFCFAGQVATTRLIQSSFRRIPPVLMQRDMIIIFFSPNIKTIWNNNNEVSSTTRFYLRPFAEDGFWSSLAKKKKILDNDLLV
jgi:hypothetical protein